MWLPGNSTLNTAGAARTEPITPTAAIPDRHLGIQVKPRGRKEAKPIDVETPSPLCERALWNKHPLGWFVGARSTPLGGHDETETVVSRRVGSGPASRLRASKYPNRCWDTVWSIYPT